MYRKESAHKSPQMKAASDKNLNMFFNQGNSTDQLRKLQKNNINQSFVINKSKKILSKYNFRDNFINYCTINIQIINEKVYIFINFPIDSTRNKGCIYYFRDRSNFSIHDALISDEIPHNEDLNYRGELIEYSCIKAGENKAYFSRLPYNKISLAVLLRDNTYTNKGQHIVTEIRGNKELYGLVYEIYPSDVFVECPQTLRRDAIIEIKPPSSVFSFSKLLRSYSCAKMQACYKYLSDQGFDFDFFDGNGNRCYCADCFPNNWINTQVVAGEIYIIPRGWTRFGLKNPIILSVQNDIWNSWCNVFHGTNPTAAKSIIRHKTLLINKDITLEGIKLGRNSSADDWNNYYVSPHICYASHPWYSKIIQLGKRNGKNRYAQVVLACKIRYGIYNKQQETEGGAKKIFDDYSVIPENEIEWYSNKRGCVVPYGVLVRIFGETKKKEVERLA